VRSAAHLWAQGRLERRESVINVVVSELEARQWSPPRGDVRRVEPDGSEESAADGADELAARRRARELTVAELRAVVQPGMASGGGAGKDRHPQNSFGKANGKLGFSSPILMASWREGRSDSNLEFGVPQALRRYWLPSPDRVTGPSNSPSSPRTAASTLPRESNSFIVLICVPAG
jgi:hypothetical protein